MFETTIVELRAAEGGNDAKLFVEDLYAMYQKFCRRMGFHLEELRRIAGRMGTSELRFKVVGDGSYS